MIIRAAAASERNRPSCACKLIWHHHRPIRCFPRGLRKCLMDVEHSYRAYMLGSDGHIVLRVDLTCDDDEAAKRQAKALVDDYDVELWDGGRKIAEFKTTKSKP